MEASAENPDMLTKILERLEAIDAKAQSERQAIRDELRANRHLMTDFWMADTVQSMSKAKDNTDTVANANENVIKEIEEEEVDTEGVEQESNDKVNSFSSSYAILSLKSVISCHPFITR